MRRAQVGHGEIVKEDRQSIGTRCAHAEQLMAQVPGSRSGT